MAWLDYPYPLRGLDTAWGYESQPRDTTRLELNMVVQDPRTRRIRGSQRWGMGKWTSAGPVDAGGPVKDLLDVPLDKPLTTYAVLSTPTVAWSTRQGQATAVQTNRNGDAVFLLDPAALAIFNSKGNEAYSLGVPVLDSSHRCHALLVDPFDTIYVGTTAGTDQSKAAIFAFQSVPDGAPELLWTIETGMWVEQLRYHNGRLYALCNDDETWKGWVRSYGDIETAVPELEWQREVSYPARDMDINSKGAFFVTAPAFADRGKDPSLPALGPSAVNWTPKDLVDPERLWSWYDAEDLDADETFNADYDDGDRVWSWRDKSGRGNHLRNAYTGDADLPPRFKKRALGVKPGVSFNGLDESLAGAEGTSKDAFDGQRGPIPWHAGSQFAVFVVCRPEEGAIRALLSHPVAGGGSGRAIFVNRASGSSFPGTNTSGKIGVFQPTDAGDPGGGNNGHPIAGSFNVDETDACIVTWICDNDQGTPLSSFRVNGEPIDTYQSDAHGGDVNITRLGAPGTWSSGWERFRGAILEIVVLFNPTTSASPAFLDFKGYPDVSYVASASDEVEVMEGYLAHKWGLGPYLNDQNNSGGGGAFGLTHSHPYGPGDLNAPPSPDGRFTSGGNSVSAIGRLYQTGPVLAKFNESGKIAWSIGDPNESGIGLSVVVQEDDSSVFTLGAATAPGGGGLGQWARRIIDFGQDYSIVNGDGAWGKVSLGGPPPYDPIDARQKLALDSRDNLYVPGHDPSAITTDPAPFSVRVLKGSDGSLVSTILLPDEQMALGVAPRNGVYDYVDDSITVDDRVFVATRPEQFSTLTATGQPSDGNTATCGGVAYRFKNTLAQANDVKIGASAADTLQNLKDAINLSGTAGTDYGTGTVRNPLCTATKLVTGTPSLRVEARYPDQEELTFLEADLNLAWSSSTVAISPATPTCHRLDMVSATLDAAGTPREIIVVGVSAGKIRKLTPSTNTAPAGSGTLAQPELDTVGQFIHSVVHLGKAYYVDGSNERVFDPREDTVTAWECTSPGELHPRCRGLESWRGRAVLYRAVDDPWNYWMSKVGDFHNFDMFPGLLTSTQATFGNHPQGAGQPGDIINTFIPWGDDLGIWGCDHTIVFMTGDPMKGGEMDVVSKSTGLSFGRCWTIDPDGVVYAYGAQGGVYAINPGSREIRRITRRRIENKMDSINLGTHHVRMAWDRFREGLHVFFVPFGSGGALVQHYFWYAPLDRWSELEYGVAGATSVQPTSVLVHDGDQQSDRVVLVGCEDGHLRQLDDSALDDDGVPIIARCLYGPLAPRDLTNELEVSGFKVVLGNEYNGGLLSVYADDEAARDPLPKPKETRRLRAGRNEAVPVLARGSALWFEISNPWAGQALSVEKVAVDVNLGDEQRVRA